MAYTCMCFGWYMELLLQAQAADLAAAEQTVLEMLDCGGMIVHVYRETDPDTPELVGRHARLRSFCSSCGGTGARIETAHEVERYLLDAAASPDWVRASKSGGALDERWRVVEFWPPAAHDSAPFYGKATLVAR